MLVQSLLDLVEGFEEIRKGDIRFVKCGACGQKVKDSIVPHVKSRHPELWEKWVKHFIQLRTEGHSYKRIMWEFKRLFSWSVIRKEIFPRDPLLFADVKVREYEPVDFKLETTTLWNFPKRGSWATHTSHYPGNWPPQVPRNLILRYSRAGDVVLDPFVGCGTTLIECLLLGRHCIGVDINPYAVKLTERRLKGLKKAAKKDKYPLPKVNIVVTRGDAKDLSFINDHYVNLVCAHPPYLNTIRYTKWAPEDLSRISSLNDYIREMRKVIKELKRVLKKDGICAIMIGDVRKEKRVLPLGFKVFQTFIEEGFEVQDIIIKKQERCSFDEFYLNSDFLRIAHEYVFVFKNS
jgi:DNA modification methylase